MPAARKETSDDRRVHPLQDRPRAAATSSTTPTARAGALLDASPHCERWQVGRCIDEPEKQIVRIEWDSVEGHLQGFRKSPDFGAFFEAVRPFFDDIEEMTHYDVVLTS